MKIIFEDGSFLEIGKMDQEILFSMCGKKGNKLTMTSTALNKKQANDLIVFLQKCLIDAN